MKVVVEKKPKSQAKLTIEIDPAELKSDLDSAAARISSRTAIPGFRPGKAPYDVIAKHVGEHAIWQESLATAVPKSFVKAIKDHGLSTIGSPDISVEKLAPGNPMTFTATIALLPNIVLSGYDNLKARLGKLSYAQNDVEKNLEELRKVIAKETPVTRPAASGDRLELDIDMYVDRVPIEGGKTRNHTVILGDGNLIPGFEEQIVGMTPGQNKTFELTFPKDYHARHHAGKKGEFQVSIHQVFERALPALDDTFAHKISGLPTLDALRKRVEEDLRESMRKRAEKEYEVAIIDELVRGAQIDELPDTLLNNELDRLIHELKHDVEHRGMKFSDYIASMKKDETTLRKELLPSAERRVKTSLIIRKIAELEKISVSQQEINEEVKSIRQTLSSEEQQKLSDDDLRNYAKTILVNRKAIAAVKAKQKPAS